MKIRLAKKIMKANLEVYPFYWHRRWTPYHLYVCTVNKPWGAKKDHRITKAISLTNHWNARRYINELIKSNKKHPFKLRDVQRHAERLKQYSV